MPGLARATIAGGPAREYHIELNPAELALYNITADDVTTALAQATAVTAVGVRDVHYVRDVLVVDASIKSSETLGQVMVPTAHGGAVPIAVPSGAFAWASRLRPTRLVLTRDEPSF